MTWAERSECRDDGWNEVMLCPDKVRKGDDLILSVYLHKASDSICYRNPSSDYELRNYLTNDINNITISCT